MFENIISFDKDLFLAINGLNGNSWVDSVMVFYSAKMVWIPMYLLVALAMFITFKKSGGRFKVERRELRLSLIFVAGAILTFAFTDSFSNVIKDIFQRPRPSHNPEFEGIIRMLESRGGLYGFVSNHAANVFGFAVFTSMFFKNRLYGWWIFIWAVMVSFSRIYVGKHYPGDVLFGALEGAMAGYIIYKLSLLLYNHLTNRNVLHNR